MLFNTKMMQLKLILLYSSEEGVKELKLALRYVVHQLAASLVILMKLKRRRDYAAKYWTSHDFNRKKSRISLWLINLNFHNVEQFQHPIKLCDTILINTFHYLLSVNSVIYNIHFTNVFFRTTIIEKLNSRVRLNKL